MPRRTSPGRAYIAVYRYLFEHDLQAVHLPDGRLRRDLDEADRAAPTASRTTIRPASSARIRSSRACSTPAPSSASSSRSTTAARWTLAAAEPAGDAGHRSARPPRRRRDLDDGAGVLDHGRHLAAAAAGASRTTTASGVGLDRSTAPPAGGRRRCDGAVGCAGGIDVEAGAAAAGVEGPLSCRRRTAAADRNTRRPRSRSTTSCRRASPGPVVARDHRRRRARRPHREPGAGSRARPAGRRARPRRRADGEW